MKTPFHVRPFPQEPHRGGKELEAALSDLESALGAEIPDFVAMGEIKKKIHETASHFNDDLLVDMLRRVSEGIDALKENPSREGIERLATDILKVRVQLKSL